jgi:hypothetical protein
MKFLSNNDKQQLLALFPKNLKLSYKNCYKKVLKYDMVCAIPSGQNAYVWFTTFQGEDLCLLLIKEDNNNIKDVYIQAICFDFKLAFGTILYGTYFKHKEYKHFSLEHIFYYKGQNTSHLKWKEQLLTYQYIFKYDIKQVAYNKTFLIIGLPIICLSDEDLLNKISLLSYKIKYIEYRYNNNNIHQSILYTEFNKVYFSNSINIKQTNKPNITNFTYDNKKNINNNFNYNKNVVFRVTPDIQNDIYYLYTNNDDNFYDIAYIPDYTTSVRMNTLFRNIKENINLDSLEESDDESEFENEKIDKYVYLDKQYNMICKYSFKFKRWVPIKVVETSMKIVERSDLPPIQEKK